MDDLGDGKQHLFVSSLGQLPDADFDDTTKDDFESVSCKLNIHQMILYFGKLKND